VVLAGFIDAGWATVASLGRAVLMKPQYNRLLGRFSGVVLMGGGVWLSLVRQRA
jgi:threonine/homoserine/homoserine lactone efflux protein